MRKKGRKILKIECILYTTALISQGKSIKIVNFKKKWGIVV
jgi:hypothetical protein